MMFVCLYGKRESISVTHVDLRSEYTLDSSSDWIPHPKHTEVDIGFLSLYNNHLSPNLNADPPETEMQFFLM